MSKRPVDLLLEDIIEAIERIRQYIKGLPFEKFLDDRKTIDAVVRNMEIIGEAANRLPEEFRQNHPEVEWYKVIGLRHRIVHEYFGIDIQIIWQILQKDLPELLQKITQM
ncbi:MAG: DUF86 domain-containing protein [Phycisphaerae bacterium]|jgi:uncharacterized protein with HEPN domain